GVAHRLLEPGRCGGQGGKVLIQGTLYPGLALAHEGAEIKPCGRLAHGWSSQSAGTGAPFSSMRIWTFCSAFCSAPWHSLVRRIPCSNACSDSSRLSSPSSMAETSFSRLARDSSKLNVTSCFLLMSGISGYTAGVAIIDFLAPDGKCQLILPQLSQSLRILCREFLQDCLIAGRHGKHRAADAHHIRGIGGRIGTLIAGQGHGLPLARSGA